MRDPCRPSGPGPRAGVGWPRTFRLAWAPNASAASCASSSAVTPGRTRAWSPSQSRIADAVASGRRLPGSARSVRAAGSSGAATSSSSGTGAAHNVVSSARAASTVAAGSSVAANRGPASRGASRARAAAASATSVASTAPDAAGGVASATPASLAASSAVISSSTASVSACESVVSSAASVSCARWTASVASCAAAGVSPGVLPRGTRSDGRTARARAVTSRIATAAVVIARRGRPSRDPESSITIAADVGGSNIGRAASATRARPAHRCPTRL